MFCVSHGKSPKWVESDREALMRFQLSIAGFVAVQKGSRHSKKDREE